MSSPDDNDSTGPSPFRAAALMGRGMTTKSSGARPATMSLRAQDNPHKNRKRPNLVGPQEIVKVTVHTGPEGVVDDDQTHHQTFPLHKGHVCHYSPFFDAAFNGNFAEGESQEVELHEVPPAIFGIFANWLYTQDIVTADGDVPTIHALVHLFRTNLSIS
ncbi:hypothetical protein ONS96_001734 [Cadophora gregata f. sp. sojae]|nr:hypothetical protein ONS96_001734 [Cadophora gregata f. sp. sojae]